MHLLCKQSDGLFTLVGEFPKNFPFARSKVSPHHYTRFSEDFQPLQKNRLKLFSFQRRLTGGQQLGKSHTSETGFFSGSSCRKGTK